MCAGREHRRLVRMMIAGLCLLLATAPTALPAQDADVAPGKWQAPPAPPGARITPVKNVRIVDYGDDYVYHGHGYMGSARPKEDRLRTIPEQDLDEDGDRDDCISYIPFSLEQPLNPAPPHWDPEASNSVFYGGVTGYFADSRQGGFSELMCNSFETPDGDNLTMMSFGTREKQRAYGLWLWKKEDFFNGGDENRVSLDNKSWIGLHCMRAWTAIDNARFVIRDGEAFYISEYNFGTPEAQKTFRESKTGFVFSVCPAETRWARYEPEAPYNIIFDPDTATWEKHDFQDVQVAGYYIAKHEWNAANVATKWYGFEVFGTVHRPERPSETLDMARIPGGNGVDHIHMSRTEVPYALWQKVRRWAVAQMYARHGYEPYMAGGDGDMGSMDYDPSGEFGPGLLPHGPNEPVTDVTWLDAVTWCNMLSEYEGKTPVYYFTPDFKVVYRREMERRVGGKRDPWFTPRVYVKWDADGYRLPTPAEWLNAAGTAPPADETAWIGSNSEGTTHAVGTRTPNANGLYDMRGNVWELVWDVGASYQEDEVERYPGKHVVLGGDMNYPADPWSKPASRYGDVPDKGNYNIGFRVVRSIAGARPPLNVKKESDFTGPVPSWSFGRLETGPGEKPKVLPKGETLLETVQVPEGQYVRWDTAKIFTSPFAMPKFEVTFRDWKQVYDWAVANGFVFNKDGDMGSMDRQTALHEHGPDEPVTDVNRFDVMIWCNALSLMEGRKPCYYRGQAVFRESIPFRRHWTPEDYENAGYDFGKLPDLDAYIDRFGGPSYPNGLEVDWSTDGYRLPTHAEWTVAYNAGSSTPYYWGEDYDAEGKYCWAAENSGGKTHPAGQKLPNAWGLYDMAGNVWEYCWGMALGGEKQAFHETWNPKGEHPSMLRMPFHLIQGGTYEYAATPGVGANMWGTFRPGGRGRQHRIFHTPFWKGYPVIGFRPISCEARTHRRSGSEMPEDIVVLDVNLKDPVTPLQGQTHRANLQRTGVHYSKSLRDAPQVEWTFETGGPIWAQPLATRGTVYILSEDSFLYAVDTETGKEKWRYKTIGGPVTDSKDWRKGVLKSAAPTIKDNILYLGDNAGYIYALDTLTGRPKWKTTVRGAGFTPGSPVPVYGAVFAFISSYTQEGGLLAIHGETGQVLNVYRNTFYGAWQSFAFAEGNLLMANHVAGSMLDLRTGARRGFGASSWHSGHNTPVLCDGKAYLVGTGFGAADYRSGKPLYYVPIEGTSFKSEVTNLNRSENTLALWNDMAFFGNLTGHAYAYDAATGKRLWRTDLGSRVRSAPSVSTESPESKQAVVYVGCDDGKLWALDALDGSKLWSFDTGARITADAWIADGVVFIANHAGKLFALTN